MADLANAGLTNRVILWCLDLPALEDYFLAIGTSEVDAHKQYMVGDGEKKRERKRVEIEVQDWWATGQIRASELFCFFQSLLSVRHEWGMLKVIERTFHKLFKRNDENSDWKSIENVRDSSQKAEMSWHS